MTRTARLSRADAVRLATAAPVRAHGRLFSVVAGPLPQSIPSKFTCVVSKSVAAKAHDRNRIKRLCREAARLEIRKSKIPLAAMFRAKKGNKEASFKEMRTDIQFLIEKISARERTSR